MYIYIALPIACCLLSIALALLSPVAYCVFCQLKHKSTEKHILARFSLYILLGIFLEFSWNFLGIFLTKKIPRKFSYLM